MEAPHLAAMNPAEWAAATGRSLWYVEYRFRNPLDERQCAWHDVPRQGLTRLMLIAPNGEFRSFEGDGERSFFSLHFSYSGLGEAAQIIGAVGLDGDQCICWSWETRQRRWLPFRDRFSRMEYRGAGPLSRRLLGEAG